MTALRLSIIIVNWNTRDLLRECLRSLHLDAHPDWEAWVIDNASSDDSVAMVAAEFPAVRLIANGENVGFARANNQGLRASTGTYMLLLNGDTLVSPDALEHLLAFMDAQPQAGAVGPRLLRSNGVPQAFAYGNDPSLSYLARRALSWLFLRRYLHDWNTSSTQAVDWVSGACLLARRAAYEQVGGLDEAIFMYFEDNDWCLRLRQAGWRIYYCPAVGIVHFGGQSARHNPQAHAAYAVSLRYFYRKHYSRLAQFALNFLLLLYQRVPQ